LTGCGYQPPRFLSYDGPEVTRVIVHKDARRMELWHHEVLLESFGIQLGIPTGHKERRGDRRTPEGDYVIDRRNARSRFTCLWAFPIPMRTISRAQRPQGWTPAITSSSMAEGQSFAAPGRLDGWLHRRNRP
jgi:hypothetical protein